MYVVQAANFFEGIIVGALSDISIEPFQNLENQSVEFFI
jgi:hypothetical protein